MWYSPKFCLPEPGEAVLIFTEENGQIAVGHYEIGAGRFSAPNTVKWYINTPYTRTACVRKVTAWAAMIDKPHFINRGT